MTKTAPGTRDRLRSLGSTRLTNADRLSLRIGPAEAPTELIPPVSRAHNSSKVAAPALHLMCRHPPDVSGHPTTRAVWGAEITRFKKSGTPGEDSQLDGPDAGKPRRASSKEKSAVPRKWMVRIPSAEAAWMLSRRSSTNRIARGGMPSRPITTWNISGAGFVRRRSQLKNLSWMKSSQWTVSRRRASDAGAFDRIAGRIPDWVAQLTVSRDSRFGCSQLLTSSRSRRSRVAALGAWPITSVQ